MENQLYQFLHKGGKVLLVGGGIDPTLASQQILVWTGSTEEISRQLRAHKFELPSNCTALILSRWLKHKIIEPLIISARKRQITIFNNKTNSEIADLVKRMTTEPPIAAMSPVYPSQEQPAPEHGHDR